MLLRRDLYEPFDAPAWPAGVALVPFSRAMAGELHQLLRTAFASQHDGQFPGIHAWWSAMIDDPDFDAEMCFVAQAADGRLVGFVRCPASGFIQDLAVHPDWRGAGLGEALVLRCFQALKNRHHTWADLNVDPDNRMAVHLFRRLGMTPCQ